jgi:sulfur carrier protein ThiS adenylyltransferase
MNSVIRSSLADRDIRQRGLVPPERLAACQALVIGVGAIGRQVAVQLAAMGVPRLTLYDDDIVAVENLAPQGYWLEDLGISKVRATTAVCLCINPDIEMRAVEDRFKRSSERTLPRDHKLIVFCCVDSIQTRRLIWETIHHRAEFFVDGRMSAEVLRVLASATPALDRYYGTTLFSEAEAFVGSCTSKSTIYTASIAAGLMVGQWTRWLRGFPVDNDLTLNLLASELTFASPTAVRGQS